MNLLIVYQHSFSTYTFTSFSEIIKYPSLRIPSNYLPSYLSIDIWQPIHPITGYTHTSRHRVGFPATLYFIGMDVFLDVSRNQVPSLPV